MKTMSKNMKKTAALALALGMAAAGTMSSYAALSDTEAVTADVEIGTSAGAPTNAIPSGSQASTLTGTIKVTSISVQVPTAAAFEINPDKALTGKSVNRITDQSSKYAIVNTSTVPIDVSISNVTTSADGGFVQTLSALSGAKTVMFAVRESTESEPLSDEPTKWFSPDADGKVTYKVSTEAAKNTVAAKATLSMKLYGSTTTGWTNGNTFTVVPTFTISVHQETPTP